MIDVERIDDKLYKSVYGKPRVGNYEEIWNEIKSNPEILREAVKVIRDKFDENDIVKGITICDAMLIDYESVDEIAYNKLINSIYSNKDIARIVLDGASNGGFSYLLMSLWNHKIRLTDEQKAFAVDEAMNKIGTVRYKEYEDALSKKIDDKGISDDETTYLSIDGSINPVGKKSAILYTKYLFSTFSTTQAHGVGEFDIRYHLLKNPNWTLEEKQKLIMDFWYDNEEYNEFLEQWELEIISNGAYYNDNNILDRDYLYDYSYNDLFDIYNDNKITDNIWNEIKFCKQMKELRPKSYEEEVKKLIK